MLHWQAPKWLNGISLEARVIFCSTILHAILLVALFVVYQGSANFNVTVSGSMINPDAEIVFMPLHRSIKQVSKGVAAPNKQTPSKSNTVSAKEPQLLGTTIVKIRTQPTKNAAAKDKKKTQLKKEAAAKKDAKTPAKELPKDDKSPVKAEEKKSEEPAPQKTIEAKNTSNTTANAAAPIATDATSDSHIVYVGQEEMESLQAQEYIQSELAQHWAPPAGMRADLHAIITLTIDFEGNIKQVELTQPSGNLLFDAAAKKAAALITPARWAYGKKFAITFKP